MKNSLKRILAVLLILCAVMSYAVPAAYAAANEVTYNFNQLSYYTSVPSVSGKSNPLISMLQGYQQKVPMTQRYLDGDQNWTYEAACAGLCGSASDNEHLPTASSTRMLSSYNGFRISMGKDQFDWIAFRIKSPGAGTFTMNFDFCSYAGSPTIAFYIMEAEGEASSDHDTVLARQARIHAEIDPSNRIGKVDQSAGTNGSKNNTAYIGSYTFEAGKEYILVAETYELASVPDWYAYFSSVTFTKNGTEGTPMTGEPELSSIQVLQNAVPASDGGYMGAVWEVSGHDYFFLPLEGSRMAIYDLDKLAAGEEPLVMMVNTGLYYPTHATVTDDGKVIVGGDGRRMFVFDTQTMTGRNTPDFRSTEGLEGEGHNASSFYNTQDGLIYFGTSYGGHMARYNMETRTYEDLGDIVCQAVQEMALGKKLAGDLVDDTGSVKAIACCGGFVYGLANSNNYHIIVKYDLTAKKVVGALNVTQQISGGSNSWGLTVLGDKYIIAGASGVSGMVLVDIATFSLVGINQVVSKGLFTSEISRAEDAWLNGMTGHATEVVNGKQFFFVNSTGMYSYEVATGKMAYVGSGISSFKTGAKTLVTLDRNKDGEEEEYLFSYAGGGQPRLFKPTAGNKISMNGLQVDMNEAGGSAINIGDSYDDVLYIGAWNNWNCVAYDTGAEAVKSRYVTGGQTDSQVSYVDEDGFHLVSGNYSACVVYEIDPDNKTGYGGDPDSNILMPLIYNMKQYDQKRIHTVTGGDGYVFAGTIPTSYKYGGGVGVYNRATGKEDFIHFKQWPIRGEKVVPNPELWDLAVQCIEYYDGRLFGTTTRSGGSGAGKVDGTSARIFVLDYENMTIEATLDLREYLTLVDANKDGVEDPIDYVSSICVDEKGRFWGLCSDVLFCFTYDKETKTFKVQEVLNLGHSEYSTNASAAWKSHKVLFDPANRQLFVSFYNYGMRQVTLANWNAGVGSIRVSSNTQILTNGPATYALGANNNLYYVSGAHLYMRPVNVSSSDPAWTAAKSVDNMINALGDITIDKADTVAAAKAAYNALSLREKALVQETLALQEAEVQVLRQQVDEIYATVTAEDYEMLDEIYRAYMNMTDRQKRYIRNSDLLEEAIFKAAMFKLSETLNQLQKDIYALELNTLEDTQKVLDLRQAYVALPDDQKSVVNIDKLIAAEEKLDALRKESGEDVDSGVCGEGLTWVLDSKGRLTISGDGTIENYPASGAPWYQNHIFIRELELDGGITAIGDHALSGLSNLQTVYYGGTEAQKDSFLLENGNDGVLTAQWHYGYTRIVLGSQIVHYCSCCDLYYFPDSTQSVFADVSNTSWQITHAIYACQKGLMAGKGTDALGRIKFDPNSPISRQEFVQMLYNAENKPAVTIDNPFPDVKDDWYKNAVLWANQAGIASGMGNGNFGVGMNITRQDLAMMLYKYARMRGCSLGAEEGKIYQFADGDKVAGYAKIAMDWAVTNGILSGKGSAGADISTFRLDPIGTATRAECAAMLKNFMTVFHETLTGCRHSIMTEIIAKDATCTQTGNIAYWTCDECGRYFNDPEEKTLILPEDIVIEMVDHNWVDATGTGPKICSVCGGIEGEDVPHSLSFQETVAPTCSGQGYDLYKCDHCDYTEKQNYVPAIDHNYVKMDLPAAATIAVEADPTGPNGLKYAKYAVADYCDYDTQICTVCNNIDDASTHFRYSQLEAAQMMLQWVNDLRAEVYGTHAYDLELESYCQRMAESRALQLVDDYSHNGALLTENIDNRLGLYAQFLAWKNSEEHYNTMINKVFFYIGYGYAEYFGYDDDIPSNAFGCMTFG